MTVDDKRPRRRRLSAIEHELWRGVTRSVAPLKRRPRKLLAAAVEPAAAERKGKPVPVKRVQATPLRGTAATKSAPPVPPPLIPLDRRLKQRLARGGEPIAARLDLHGRTQSEAHSALLRFLQRAQADGAKTVLVITGKGGGASDFARERGVLKRQVPLWLTLPEFRALVLGVEDAHVGHGGEGALYVRVRRVR
jgi:DNA-nicking Smr family endonuclease